jgi:hypothetical protein
MECPQFGYVPGQQHTLERYLGQYIKGETWGKTPELQGCKFMVGQRSSRTWGDYRTCQNHSDCWHRYDLGFTISAEHAQAVVDCFDEQMATRA